MKQEVLEKMYTSSLLLLKEIIKMAENTRSTNSREFLDWLDSINELSVKY